VQTVTYTRHAKQPRKIGGRLAFNLDCTVRPACAAVRARLIKHDSKRVTVIRRSSRASPEISINSRACAQFLFERQETLSKSFPKKGNQSEIRSLTDRLILLHSGISSIKPEPSRIPRASRMHSLTQELSIPSPGTRQLHDCQVRRDS
jgi:hypothetical protein